MYCSKHKIFIQLDVLTTWFKKVSERV